MSQHLVTCPHCRTPLRSERPIPVGSTLTCPDCKSSFTVQVEQPMNRRDFGKLAGTVLCILVCGGVSWVGWRLFEDAQGAKTRQREFEAANRPVLQKDGGPTTPAGTNMDFTGLRGVLAGKWQDEEHKDPIRIMEFTEKAILVKFYSANVGKYELDGDLLRTTDRNGGTNVYGLEFLSDGEIALRPEKSSNGTNFNDLQGHWRRISLPPSKSEAPVGTGPVADAKRQVLRIEQKVAKVETLLETALADRDEVVKKLRAVGVNSTADLKGNIRGRRLAENVAKITTEIDGVEKQLVSLDAELLKAKAIVRRMEREQAGLSEAEMRRLSQQLREAEERTDGIASTPTTPLDVDAAVEKALKATPRSGTPKKSGK